MGCTGSRFDEMPVTGHPHGIKVLPGSERSLSMMMMAMMVMMMMMMITQPHSQFKYPHTTNYKKNTVKFMVSCVPFRRINFRYMMRDLTVLKLREKFFSFSGDDCTIKDMDGKDWFKYVHNLEKRICKYLSSIKDSRLKEDENMRNN